MRAFRRILVLSAVFVAVEARAASPAEFASARVRFLQLLQQRAETGQPAVIPLPRVLVRSFDRTLSRYVRRNGLRPPPITRHSANLRANQVFFRQAFTLERLRQRGISANGGGGGISINAIDPAASPAATVSPVNVFNFFPVFTAFGDTTGSGG